MSAKTEAGTNRCSGASMMTSHLSHLQLCPSSTTFFWQPDSPPCAGYETLSDLTNAIVPLRLK